MTSYFILRALGPFAAGYFASYLFRVVNAAISSDLVHELSLSNTDLGLMTSMYLYGFVLFQLPLGLLLDRFGPRLVQTGLLVIASIGAGLFAWADGIYALAGARLLIGIGLSGCLMAAFKANTIWLKPARLALGNSTIVTFGGLGFLAGTYPANLATDLIGWRALFVVLMIFTLLIAATIYCFVPQRDIDRRPIALVIQLKGYATIFTNSTFWRVTPMIAAISGSFIAVQTLWATRWMIDVAELEWRAAGQQLMILGLAFALGSLSTGFIADIFQRRGVELKVIVGIAFLVYATAQLVMIFRLPIPLPLIWIVYGFAGQAANLGYATLGAYFGWQLAGRAQSAANLMLFLASALFQSSIGWALDFLSQNMSIPLTQAYAIALGTLLIFQALAFTWYVLGRYDETRLATD